MTAECLGPNAMRVAVTITERDGSGGWAVHFPASPDLLCETATDALNLVIRTAREYPHSSIVTITWEPRTSIGRSVVKVVTS